MPTGVSPDAGIREDPYSRTWYTPAIVDSWNWSEGRPMRVNSPLLPYAVHPWMYQRNIGSYIEIPRYQCSNKYKVSYDATESGMHLRFATTDRVVYNSPTYIMDHHIISLRRQVESLWAPKFYAHVHMGVTGEISVNALKMVTHHEIVEPLTMAFGYISQKLHLSKQEQQNNYYTTYNRQIYSYGGSTPGASHCHVWGAGSSGRQVWTATLELNHGGSIPPEVGNYTVVGTPTYKIYITKHWRDVLDQGNLPYTHDFERYTQTFHQAIPELIGSFRVVGYCRDAGALYLHTGNTLPGGSHATMLPNPFKAWGVTASTIPVTENALAPWFIGGWSHGYTKEGAIVEPTGGFGGRMWVTSNGRSGIIPNNILYTQTREVIEGEGYSWSHTIAAENTTRAEPKDLAGGKWIKSLIGTRVTTVWFVTIQDLLGRVTTHAVRDVEFSGEIP